MYLKSQLQLINQDQIQTPARIYIDRELGDRLDHSLPTMSGEEQFAALPPGAQTAAGSSRSSPRRRGSAAPREQALSSSSIDSRQKHTSATPPSVDALEFNCVVATFPRIMLSISRTLLPPLVRLLQRHARHLFAVMPQRILLLSEIPPRLATQPLLIGQLLPSLPRFIWTTNCLRLLMISTRPLLPRLAPSQFKGAVQPITEAGQGHTRFIYNDAGTHIASKTSPTTIRGGLEFPSKLSRSWFL